MPTLFRPHGSSRIDVQGRKIIRHMEGPWNLEFVHMAHHDLQTLANFDYSTPWVTMLIVQKSALCSPDALRQIASHLQLDFNRQRLGTAWVYPPGTEGAAIMQKMLTPLYKESGPVAFFSCIDEADSWLNTLLAQLTGLH